MTSAARDPFRGSPASMFGALPAVGRIIRETLYAPPCPEQVALFFEVALTHHNAQQYESAIVAYLDAMQAWEASCATELEKQQGLHGVSLEPRRFTPSAAAVKAQQLWAEQQAARQAQVASPQAAADNGGGTVQPSASPVEVAAAPKKAKKGASGSSTDEEAALANLSPAEILAREEAAHHAAEVARLSSLIEARAALREQAVSLVPLEGRVFLRLAIGSVFESAGHDSRALSEYHAAHQLATGLPAAHVAMIMATAYSSLGSAYYHVSQYDYAADYFFRTLEIRYENNNRANHVDVGQAANNIGAVLIMLERPNDALVMLHRAKAIFEDQHLGHPTAHVRMELVDQNIAIARRYFMSEAVPLPPCRVVYAKKPAPPPPKGKTDAATGKGGAKKGK